MSSVQKTKLFASGMGRRIGMTDMTKTRTLTASTRDEPDGRSERMRAAVEQARKDGNPPEE